MIEIVIAIVFAAGAGALAFWWQLHEPVRLWCDRIALIALFCALTAAAGAVVRTVLHQTVFLTEVHMVLLNPLFLIGGAYLSFHMLAAAIVTAFGFKGWTVKRLGQGE